MNALVIKPGILRTILPLILVTLLLLLPSPLPPEVGVLDFRPYWSASFLLAQGRDFGDVSQLDHIERTLTGWTAPYTMYAWLGPTGNLILLPYTLFPFTRAAYYWLLTNIAIVFISVLLIWRDTASGARWIPLVAAFGFSMSLLSLIVGQINTLVLLGLATFLAASRAGHCWVAGAGLALTTVKPHLVILTLPLLVLDLVRRKQWRTLAGLVTALGGCAIILFCLYPAWPVSFLKVVISGINTWRKTPTIPGLLVVAGEYVWGKWLWVAALLLAVLLWWKRGSKWELRTMIDVSILVGLIVSPLGWSYDQMMLLFPLLRVLAWITQGALTRKDAIAVVSVLVVANALSFYERILTPSEVWFFWVPPVVAAVYLFAWSRRGRISEGMEVRYGA
ncbi:MAG: DUF2029 domain-containing protein [Anaerolineae bacterium]|nr:DUF2029 domain-containing protein [Anaerolineae bacterium]